MGGDRRAILGEHGDDFHAVGEEIFDDHRGIAEEDIAFAVADEIGADGLVTGGGLVGGLVGEVGEAH